MSHSNQTKAAPMLRHVRANDLPRLMVIEIATQVFPWSEDVFIQCMQPGYVGWVLEQEEKIIGFVFVSLLADECHILNLCVAPDYQHQGFGRQLLVHALQEVSNEGAGIAYLEVRRSNQHALALYKKLGFRSVGERKGYYRTKNGNEDALVLAKDLGV